MTRNCKRARPSPPPPPHVGKRLRPTDHPDQHPSGPDGPAPSSPADQHRTRGPYTARPDIGDCAGAGVTTLLPRHLSSGVCTNNDYYPPPPDSSGQDAENCPFYAQYTRLQPPRPCADYPDYDAMSGGNDVMGSSGASQQQQSMHKLPHPPRNSANARERDRTQSVNSAFVTLRTMIPTEPVDRKLSKIETLRLATSYISHLHTVLLVGLDCRDQPCIKHQELLGRMAAGGGGVGGRAGGGRGGHVAEEDRPSLICTFCLSASKTKNQPTRPDSCMYRNTRPPAMQTSR